MKISSRGHTLLIYIMKRNIQTDGIGPFKSIRAYLVLHLLTYALYFNVEIKKDLGIESDFVIFLVILETELLLFTFSVNIMFLPLIVC